MNTKIKVAIIGVGNCAKSLIQGVDLYKRGKLNTNEGIMRSDIGGYIPKDIEFVLAFDVDGRKVGKHLHDAIYELPNCAIDLVKREDMIPIKIIVQKAPVMDGVAPHMRTTDINDPERFYIDDTQKEVDIIQCLKDTAPDILINYCPVGSQQAVEFYAQCAIEANVAFLNCMPIFIASDPIWEKKFIDAGLPLIGDDMKSQFGASIVSQILQELAFSRGHKVKCHIQENVGGNTDFHNMKDQTRLTTKKISKENVIRSQNTIRGIDPKDSFLYAGPSNYIRYYGDNKIANFHLELEGFGGSPVIFDARMSVQDSPNSAGVVIDAIRYLKVAKELGIVGALRGPSAWTQKSPPLQMQGEHAQHECDALANRCLTEITRNQLKK